MSEITNEACAWFAQLETGDLSTEDLAAFREWINRSPRHAAEIREIAALSENLSALTDLAEPLIAAGTARKMRVGLGGFRMTGGAGLTACLMILAFVALSFLMLNRIRGENTVHQFYATEIGEYQTIELPDGSSVKLNTNSALEIKYDAKVREVRLAKGEAFFDVTHDPARPFTVYAGAHFVRAVGTAFVVRLEDDQTKLIVTKGVVEFSKVAEIVPEQFDTAQNNVVASAPANSEIAEPMLVNAGYETSSLATLQSGGPAKLSERTQMRKISWTEGLFDFSDAPLVEVIAEVSRHTDMQIEIADTKIEDVRFGGIFRIGDVEGLLRALPNVGVTVEHVDSKTIRLQMEDDTKET